MSKLGDAKILGGVGSILLFIPGASIVGWILILIAGKFISDELGDGAIFNNMIYAVITAIVGAAVGVSILFTGLFAGAFTLFTGGGAILGFLGALAAFWIFAVISSYFLKRAYDIAGTKLNVPQFQSAGKFYFWGALLVIILVGVILLLIAYIYQILAYFSIRDEPQLLQGQPTSVMGAPAAQAGMKFCPSCGTQMASSVAFCPKCGAKQ